jgi:hypothetical protein
MKFLIVKVKDKDLYFNADEMEGAYVCDTPMLMNKNKQIQLWNMPMNFVTMITMMLMKYSQRIN